MSFTTIVIPCYNEERRLDFAAFNRFLRSTPPCRLLFVNDGSLDGTLEVLRRVESSHPGIVDVLDLPHNVGKAEGVRQGVCLALERGADAVGYWDADLATPLEAIHSFVHVLDRRRDIDIVIGSRLRLLGHAIHRQQKRALLGRLFANAASWTLGLRILDTQCGAKLFRVTPWFATAFRSPFRTRWIFDVEILARLARLAARSDGPSLFNCVYECPLESWNDVAGSKLRARDFLKAPWELASIYWRYFGPLRGAPPELISPPGSVIPMPARRTAESSQIHDDRQRAAA